MREPTAEEGQRRIKRSDFTFINLRLKEATVEKKEQRDLRNLQQLHKDSDTFNSSPDAKTENLVTDTGGTGPDVSETLSPKTPV